MSELADGATASTAVPEPPSLRFANTRYAVRGRVLDGIGTPESLSAWLTRHTGELGLTGPAPEAELTAFTELRDTIRDLIAGNADDEGVALLNRLSAEAPSWPALVRTDGEFRLAERTAGTSALTALAQDAIKLLGGELRADLRACQAPGCVQFFIKDHPRREWCSPTCGNRARAARHYLRHRAG